jgi:hypothetical protein
MISINFKKSWSQSQDCRRQSSTTYKKAEGCVKLWELGKNKSHYTIEKWELGKE